MNHRWSWKLGEYAGIAVYLHWTFFLVPILVAFSALGSAGGLATAVEAVIFVLAIFGCVVLHEYGHALMARRYGIGTQDITLYPIGGVARLNRLPDRPSQELAVALAGPAVNVVIALILLVALGLSAQLGIFSSTLAAGNTFWGRLMLVNVALVVFNMLPAFPMDGGRVLRSFLAMHLPYLQATEIAVGVARVIAVLLGIVGLLASHLTLVLIAMFVYFAAGAEAQQARMRPAIQPIHQLTRPPGPYHALRAESQLANVADTLLLSPQHVFPVMSGSQLVGTLFKGDVLRAVANGWGHLTVGEFLHSR